MGSKETRGRTGEAAMKPFRLPGYGSIADISSRSQVAAEVSTVSSQASRTSPGRFSKPVTAVAARCSSIPPGRGAAEPLEKVPALLGNIARRHLERPVAQL
jgi:hypothetical protein